MDCGHVLQEREIEGSNLTSRLSYPKPFIHNSLTSRKTIAPTFPSPTKKTMLCYSMPRTKLNEQ